MRSVQFSGLALVLLILIFSFGCSSDVSGPGLASPPENAIWIDVRTAEEYAEAHVDEASNIPYDVILPGVEALALAKDAPIYLYCRSGHRAGLAKETLDAHHYTNVTNVGGLKDARAVLASKPR